VIVVQYTLWGVQGGEGEGGYGVQDMVCNVVEKFINNLHVVINLQHVVINYPHVVSFFVVNHFNILSGLILKIFLLQVFIFCFLFCF